MAAGLTAARSDGASATESGDDFLLRERAAFLFGFWDVLPWFWINRPSAVLLAENKLRQLALANAHGFRVPRTIVSNDAAAVRSFVAKQASIVKPVSGGSFVESGRTYDIHTSPVTVADLTDGAAQSAPAIYQERIDRQFDLRVTVVGTRVFASRILLSKSDQARPDWRAADPADVTYEQHRLPPSFEAACIAFVRASGLVFGALDFIVTPDGDHVFLEINPSGQWGWIEDATGARITEAIVDSLARGAA
ncbi:hypothetical protein [Bradyrhizobium cosmicum]|uniref:hypothetical protein n=1 Tax=Bradyrhizobium cosmicum TaxID=1404864 RepID=UPI0028EE9B6B|nr:hypothetical protein [Bradyrhizobium cosmicum]